MTIEAGILVKTLSGKVVMTQTQVEPGYWQCDDGRVYLAAAFREISDAERDTYINANSKSLGATS